MLLKCLWLAQFDYSAPAACQEVATKVFAFSPKLVRTTEEHLVGIYTHPRLSEIHKIKQYCFKLAQVTSSYISVENDWKSASERGHQELEDKSLGVCPCPNILWEVGGVRVHRVHGAQIYSQQL